MFFSSVLLTLKQVVILYIMAAVGFAADKTGIYKAEVSKATNDLMFYVVTPSVIVNSFFSAEFSSESGKNFLTAVIFSVFSHIIGMALSAPFFNKKDTDSVVHKFAVVYANVGYMAIPLTQAILGDEGVFYASAGDNNRAGQIFKPFEHASCDDNARHLYCKDKSQENFYGKKQISCSFSQKYMCAGCCFPYIKGGWNIR